MSLSRIKRSCEGWYPEMSAASPDQEAGNNAAEAKKEKGVSKATAQKLLAKYKQLQVKQRRR